ncbi:TonB-dependent siderophore receptor [Sphingomonas nostoxanthinifaciens]|uniref:TonB-dependent siderophore receptor n=1 Tax=Sphingomonas nostoxanthinifaciens TaxID=2872652 RepID=UPI001CC1CEA2|nr:TonB-dependent siderophore receptor [Sphingomonas nostoxanthinifaciens]UAK24160.1 TonB-dependent siderophore receptor [Sphingomonas nostoxanthinifaciens]
MISTNRTLRGILLACASLMPAVAFAADVTAEAPEGSGDEIVVTGQQPLTQSTSGTKTATPIMETPQSITVISNADISGLGLQSLNQALRYVAGVTAEQRGSSADVYDQFKLRGFDAPTYLDGLKLFPSATGYAVPQVDVSRLDRIEVVKGPASVLYGQSSPGGLVAESSKLPLDRDFYGAVAGTYGNYDLYRVDADVGGRASSNILWRLYGSANGAHSQADYGVRRRQTVSGAATIGDGTPTSLTVLANYSHDPRNGNYAVFPALGTLIPNAAGTIKTSFYGGEPGDFFKRDQAAVSAFFRHDFGGSWVFKSSLRYQYVKSSLGIIYTGGSPATTDAAPSLFSRFSYATREQNNGWTYDNTLTGVVETGPLKHTVLLGVDRQVSHSRELYAFGGATNINVFNPVYGSMPTPQTPYQVPGYVAGAPLQTPTLATTQQRQQGIYAQDQIAIEGFRLTLSGRQDWARQASETGGVYSQQHNQKFTYRVGGLYLLPFGLAPYASYSTSFEPQASQLAAGGLAKPSLGKQVEAGLKYQVPGTQIIATAAWFNIEQTNVVVSDPLTFLAYQVGKVRSRGVEAEVTAPLPYDFYAHVAFSRQRVKQLDDVNPANIGQSLIGVGKGGITANLDWSPKSGPAQGLTIGGAWRHLNGVYAGIYFDGVARYTPTYDLFDALARYEIGKIVPRLDGMTVGIDAKNIFDKKYLSSCYSNYGWCWYGNRRTVQGTIGYRW